MTKLARLMATLNRAEQGTHPASTPNSPRHRGHGRGQTDRNTPVCPSSHNGHTGLGQNTAACCSSAASRVTTASQGRGEYPTTNRCPEQCSKCERLQCSANASDARAGVHMARECATPAKPLNKDGGTEGMQSNPLLHAVNKLTTFPP